MLEGNLLEPNGEIFNAEERVAKDRNMKSATACVFRRPGAESAKTPRRAMLASHVGRANPPTPLASRRRAWMARRSCSLTHVSIFGTGDCLECTSSYDRATARAHLP
jgi:hypothetical protein